MKCFVCGTAMEPCFEKYFGMKNLDKCEYVRCPNCRLVIAKTLYEMPEKQWEEINYECNNRVFDGEINQEDVDTTVYERFQMLAKFFNELLKHGVFKYDWKTIDYGAGNGTLANMTNKTIGNVWLKKFDAYIKPRGDNWLSADEVQPESFDFLLTTSVFEHLLGNRGDVDKVIGLLKPDGVMALNLFVAEEMPDDPAWFYYLPVHCTFWTNKAMAILYKKFGFKGCMYNVEAQTWFMFRKVEDFEKLKSVVDKLTGNLVLSENFVDYWKVQPKVEDFDVDNSKIDNIFNILRAIK